MTALTESRKDIPVEKDSFKALEDSVRLDNLLYFCKYFPISKWIETDWEKIEKLLLQFSEE